MQDEAHTCRAPLSDLFRSAAIFLQRATQLIYFLQGLIQIYSLHETRTDYSVENCHMDPSHPGTPASSYSDLFPSPWHVTRSNSPHDSLVYYVDCCLPPRLEYMLIKGRDSCLLAN